MALYRVSITRYDDHDEPQKRVTVECHTRYTLTADLPEWVLAEVDPQAKIDYFASTEGGE